MTESILTFSFYKKIKIIAPSYRYPDPYPWWTAKQDWPRAGYKSISHHDNDKNVKIEHWKSTHAVLLWQNIHCHCFQCYQHPTQTWDKLHYSTLTLPHLLLTTTQLSLWILNTILALWQQNICHLYQRNHLPQRWPRSLNTFRDPVSNIPHMHNL